MAAGWRCLSRAGKININVLSAIKLDHPSLLCYPRPPSGPDYYITVDASLLWPNGDFIRVMTITTRWESSRVLGFYGNELQSRHWPKWIRHHVSFLICWQPKKHMRFSIKLGLCYFQRVSHVSNYSFYATFWNQIRNKFNKIKCPNVFNMFNI